MSSVSSQGICLWFTGLPSSGKTTVAKLVEERLLEAGVERVQRLDGDVVRQTLTADLGFSKRDRDRNIKRVTFVARLLQKQGVITLSSFITPYQSQRDYIREQVEDARVVHVHAPVEVCKERDPKNMYHKAEAGEIEGFTGVSAPYEEPPAPALRLDTHEETIEESAEKVLNYLEEEGFVSGRESLSSNGRTSDDRVESITSS